MGGLRREQGTGKHVPLISTNSSRVRRVNLINKDGRLMNVWIVYFDGGGGGALNQF